jgi:hypothetical protein
MPPVFSHLKTTVKQTNAPSIPDCTLPLLVHGLNSSNPHTSDTHSAATRNWYGPNHSITFASDSEEKGSDIDIDGLWDEDRIEEADRAGDNSDEMVIDQVLDGEENTALKSYKVYLHVLQTSHPLLMSTSCRTRT